LKPNAVLLDSNLLVLLVVGKASRDFISQHKRLSAYTIGDYDLLCSVLAGFETIILTPHTLTETSNLIRQIAEPAKSEIMFAFAELVESEREETLPSKQAALRYEFLYLGLTDSVLVELSSRGSHLLTTDVDLYLAAQAYGIPSENFNHIREYYM